MKVISRFFFDLFLLGNVEDPVTGLSVSIPGGMDWVIYVEVPSRVECEDPTHSLHRFIEDVPALGILGKPLLIDRNKPYEMDNDVQLVCKYLKEYWTFREKKKGGINKLYIDGRLSRTSFIVLPLPLFIHRWKTCEV